MRLEELSLTVEGDELRFRFHDRFTMVSGVGPGERHAFVDLVLGALTGGGSDPTVLTVVDATGLRTYVRSDGRGNVTHEHDGDVAAPDPLAAFGLDSRALSSVCHIRAADIGLLDTPATRTQTPTTPELAEAHRSLAQLDAELAEATGHREGAESLRRELSAVEEQLRQVKEGEARRHFARLMIELERVRSEAASLQGGREGAAADERLVKAARSVRTLARRWEKAAELLGTARQEFGDRDRLDPRTLDEALSAPDAVPAELDALATALDRAERLRDDLAARLAGMAADHLPTPSHPAVVRLARGDQAMAWDICREAIHTGIRVEQSSIELGGLESGGAPPAIVELLESAHTEVEAAAQTIEERKKRGLVMGAGGIAAAAAGALALPVIAPVGLAGALGAAGWAVLQPRRRLARARGVEEDTLTKAGVPTYLSFHMRRIDATIDPSTRDGLRLAALKHRRALDAWHALAGDISPVEAVELEDEVRAYANALANLEGGAEEIEATQRQLTEVAEPAVDQARDALLVACAPFGIEDPALAVTMVRQQVAIGVTARRQRHLEEIEAEEETVRGKLEARLAELGFDDGDCGARVGGFEWALKSAEDRSAARTAARPAAEIEADLARLEERVRREHRPEWGRAVTPADAAEPDPAQLQERRRQLQTELAQAERHVPDVERITDRRNALARRVAVLEGDPGTAPAAVTRADIEPELLARLAACRRPGSGQETLFLLLDEPLVKLTGPSKWETLDLIERVSADIQVVYLTDDADTVVWARRRAGAGTLSILEPVAEPV